MQQLTLAKTSDSPINMNMKNSNSIRLITLILLLGMLLPALLSASDSVAPNDLVINSDNAYVLLIGAGLTPDEVNQLGSMQGHIAALLASGEIEPETALHMAYQHIYPDYPWNSGEPEFRDGNKSFSTDLDWRVRVLPFDYQAYASGFGPNMSDVPIELWNVLRHGYLSVGGPTARANGTDSYEFSFKSKWDNAIGYNLKPDSRLYFKGSEGLILDKTSGETDSSGRFCIKASASKPGIYYLAAGVEYFYHGESVLGIDHYYYLIIEMEFVASNVQLPTPPRALDPANLGLFQDWDYSSNELPKPDIPGAPTIPGPILGQTLTPPLTINPIVPGAIDYTRSVAEINLCSPPTDVLNTASVNFYPRDKNHWSTAGDVYLTTSAGANFWTGDNAWILADGVRLTKLVGEGKTGAFIVSANNVANIQFFSKTAHR